MEFYTLTNELLYLWQIILSGRSVVLCHWVAVILFFNRMTPDLIWVVLWVQTYTCVKFVMDVCFYQQEKRSSEKHLADSERQLTALVQKLKSNEYKAKSEAESWKKSMSTLKASHEKEIASLQVGCFTTYVIRLVSANPSQHVFHLPWPLDKMPVKEITSYNEYHTKFVYRYLCIAITTTTITNRVATCISFFYLYLNRKRIQTWSCSSVTQHGKKQLTGMPKKLNVNFIMLRKN